MAQSQRFTQQKCSFADEYKAVYAPRCRCETCWTKWEAKLRAQAKRRGRVQK